MQSAKSPTGYNSLQIALHWAVAVLVLFQLVFGESMTEAVDAIEEGEATGSATDLVWGFAHYWVGVSILALVILRLVVRLVYGAPAHSSAAPSWMSAAAKFSHATFYLILVATPVLGLLAYYRGDPWGEFHSLAKPALIALIILHVIGAFVHHVWIRDNVLLRMLKVN